jgi:sulfhydrogenase subunit delta
MQNQKVRKLYTIQSGLKKMSKPKVGIYGLTGCAGCQLSIIFNEDEILDLISLIDLRAFPFIKEKNYDEEFDLVFMEGLVASANDLEVLKKVRSKTKILVALGACAHTGCIPAYRKWTLKENYEHLLYKKDDIIKDEDPSPIENHVKVDFTIPGCPPDKHEILTFIKDVLKGKTPKTYNNPVCVECRRNNNDCLLIVGKPCMGPITAGGCHSICINGGFECWGCRGPSGDANYDAWIEILREQGHDDEFIKTRMKIFAGLKMEEDAFKILK